MPKPDCRSAITVEILEMELQSLTQLTEVLYAAQKQLELDMEQ